MKRLAAPLTEGIIVVNVVIAIKNDNTALFVVILNHSNKPSSNHSINITAASSPVNSPIPTTHLQLQLLQVLQSQPSITPLRVLIPIARRIRSLLRGQLTPDPLHLMVRHDRDIIITIVQQRDAVELLEGIGRLGAGRAAGARTIVALGRHGPRVGDVDALGLLDVAEVDGVDAVATLVRDDGRLHVADQRPLGRPEEGMVFDVGGARARAETAILVFDEELPDERLASAEDTMSVMRKAG